MNQYDGEIPDYPIQNQLTNSIRKAAAKDGNPELTHMWVVSRHDLLRKCMRL